jgi:outer membrane protein assembly factor BamB
LPVEEKLAWEVKLSDSGLGGVAANDRFVLLGDRDHLDFKDIFRCFDAQSGEQLWQVEYLAVGKLDYGNSPRATPWIEGERALLLGAFGDLRCVQLSDGKVLWKRNLRKEFKLKSDFPWGYCGSPLVVDGKVIVQPGGPQASLVALQLEDGEVAWQSPGRAPCYGSLTIAMLGGKRQIVGHDVTTLGGWEIETGRRIWELTPPNEGDFNVPTPLSVDGKLLIATENNGTCLYQFQSDGQIDPTPVTENPKLRPNMSSPVVVGNRLFCVKGFLYCLDLADGLKELYRQRDPAIAEYAAILADEERILVIGKGELLLLDATQDKFHLLSRLRAFDDSVEIYSYPAIVGNRLYLRGATGLKCLELE